MDNEVIEKVNEFIKFLHDYGIKEISVLYNNGYVEMRVVCDWHTYLERMKYWLIDYFKDVNYTIDVYVINSDSFKDGMVRMVLNRGDISNVELIFIEKWNFGLFLKKLEYEELKEFLKENKDLWEELLERVYNTYLKSSIEHSKLFLGMDIDAIYDKDTYTIILVFKHKLDKDFGFNDVFYLRDTFREMLFRLLTNYEDMVIKEANKKMRSKKK